MAFPAELKNLKQFVVWKGDKQPYSAITMKQKGWNLEVNWTTYKDALRVCKEAKFTGIGFVFKFPYVGVDLDNCIEDGLMNDFARDITSALDTFTEYSKSGNGLHLYCKVDKPIEALKTETLEIYGEGRFFICTGKELDSDQLEVTNQTKNIDGLIATYRTEPVRTTATAQPVTVGEGNRNNRMAAEIGRMFNYWDKDTVFNMAHTLNQTICKPPLEDKELNIIIESISKRNIKQIQPKPIEQLGRDFIDGKRDLDKTPYRGIAKLAGAYISTGIESIDYAMNDLAPGCVTLLTGRMNGGKSTFVKQVTANAVNDGIKVFIVSGEGDQELSINSLYECVIGRDNEYYDLVKINKRWHKEPKEHVLKALQAWHKGKLTLFSKGESKFKTTNELFEMIEIEVKENGTQLIVIDNLMSILTAKATEKNEAQAEFMQRCHDLAEIYKVHIILVLHPNKEYRKGQDLDVEQISGTSDLGNKADNIIAVIREYKEENISIGINGKIALIKNRYYPNLPITDVHFDKDTGLLLEIKDGQPIGYGFNWKKYLDEKYQWVEYTEGVLPF